PMMVQTFAAQGAGILTTGLFAQANNRSIGIVIRGIRLVHGNVEIFDAFPESGKPASMGHGDLYLEFSGLTSERAKAEEKRWIKPKGTSAELLTMIHYIKLAEKYDKEVGGPVDALEFRKDGSVKWLHRKKNCPAYAD